jgi:hypothetical protein
MDTIPHIVIWLTFLILPSISDFGYSKRGIQIFDKLFRQLI